jgi:THO complex subunit 4
LKRAFLHIGPSGKSAGIADVVFATNNDAERAKVTYNNVELDGKKESLLLLLPTSYLLSLFV